jgi:hypothetical protein
VAPAARAGLFGAQRERALLEGFEELADELEEMAKRASEEERRGATRGDEGRGATSDEG